jgi:hypothetical protein
MQTDSVKRRRAPARPMGSCSVPTAKYTHGHEEGNIHFFMGSTAAAIFSNIESGIGMIMPSANSGNGKLKKKNVFLVIYK